MTLTSRHLAVAAVLATLSMPAYAADSGPDCSVCDDPTWPEIRDPMPAVVIRDGAAGSATVQSDPTWPTIASVAPPLQIERAGPGRRVVHR